MQAASTAARRQYRAILREFEDVLYGRISLDDLEGIVYANPRTVQWVVYCYLKNRGTWRERGLGKFLSEQFDLTATVKPPRPDGAAVADQRSNGPSGPAFISEETR